MKTRSSSVLTFIAMIAMVGTLASCGNSQKKREKAAEKRMTEQSAEPVTVYESETVVVAVDSLTPDSAAMKQNQATPKRTK